MECAKLYPVDVGFCNTYILSKWIQAQYGGKPCFNLGGFHVNQLGRTLGNMSLEVANYA
jgi:hypothetical protein